VVYRMLRLKCIVATAEGEMQHVPSDRTFRLPAGKYPAQRGYRARSFTAAEDLHPDTPLVSFTRPARAGPGTTPPGGTKAVLRSPMGEVTIKVGRTYTRAPARLPPGVHFRPGVPITTGTTGARPK